MLAPDIRRVAVFRALMLGDLLCATPALRALRQGLPGAHIALVGLPWAREWAERLDSVDEFIEFPGWPGLPERTPADARSRLDFLMAMCARQFDLALQMHGSGAIVNTLTAAFGAHLNAGFCTPGGAAPAYDAARFLRWPATGTEVERLLALTDHLGLARQGLHLDFPLRDADRAAAQALLQSGPGLACDSDSSMLARRWVLVHPGSQWPSRRWPAERFAAVADLLADQGCSIALTGTAAEAELTRAVAATMRAPALDLAGRTTLWSLGALIERASLLVCNDTGVSHVAAALGTPTTVVANGSDVQRWAPSDHRQHVLLWHDMACRPCSHAVCPIDNACAKAVATATVARVALQQVQLRRASAAAH